MRAAFECEFTLATRSADGAYAPLDESLCFSAVGFTPAAQVMDDIVAALEAQGIETDQYYPELGHGQQELPIRHAPALAAADRQVFYRETVRNVAYQHGLYASLAPKPFPEQAGNGAHIHFSLWDKAGRRSLMHDPESPVRREPARLSLHRRGARPSARAARAHLPSVQLLSPPPAALLELSLHRLGAGQPRGRGPRPLAVQIQPRRFDQRRTQGV